MSRASTSQSDKMNALIHLAGEVAHELNNIFTAVTGNLSLLSEELQPEGMPAGMIDEINRTAQRGIALSQKLQAFAGRQPLERKTVDVVRVLAESVADLRKSLPKRVRVELAPLPQGFASFVDEEKLRATLQELASNAVAAMNGNGTLCFEAQKMSLNSENRLGLRPGSYIRITARDDGRGMKPDVAARALDPLFSTKTAHINAGWGLSNCAGFARQSGGAMHLRTSVGAGTSVEIYLPAYLSTAG